MVNRTVPLQAEVLGSGIKIAQTEVLDTGFKVIFIILCASYLAGSVNCSYRHGYLFVELKRIGILPVGRKNGLVSFILIRLVINRHILKKNLALGAGQNRSIQILTNIVIRTGHVVEGVTGMVGIIVSPSDSKVSVKGGGNTLDKSIVLLRTVHRKQNIHGVNHIALCIIEFHRNRIDFSQSNCGRIISQRQFLDISCSQSYTGSGIAGKSHILYILVFCISKRNSGEFIS